MVAHVASAKVEPVVPLVVVHGGAGMFPSALHDDAHSGCERAARIGHEVLAGGGDALEAVQAAVRVLEDDPTFNAGVGSVLTRDGEVEVDAAIMDGRGARMGAIAAMRNARRPIEIARAVLDDGEHVLLCAEGAWAFARERGFAPCDPGELVTERSRDRLAREAARRAAGEPGEGGGGTVGACAVDARGHVAAATSTGGMVYKRRGRIGDTPLPGCGTFADDHGGAASATGHGEAVARALVAGRCVDRIRSGASPDAAAWACIDQLAVEIGSTAGVICCGPHGRVGAAHNTPHMPTGVAFARGGETRVVAVVTVPRGWDPVAG